MSATTKLVMTPVAAAVSAAFSGPGAALAQEDNELRLEEITVTARKRTEDLQKIPFSVQAIPQLELQRIGAIRMEDYARFIPTMSFVSTDAGQSEIIFRGISTGGVAIAQAPASVYIDELALTTTGSIPDVRPVDVARIEALAGPQGTLFGGSNQSGTLRIVNNQPDPSQFEGIADISLRTGSSMSNSYDVSGVLNLPLVEDKFAIRLVAYTALDGGFIDNVFGHTPDTHEWLNLTADSGTLDNADVVEENYNDINYKGGRIAARWDVNEDWAVTFAYQYQNQEAKGGNDYDPFVGDLQTIKFNKQFRNDKWGIASITLEADLGFAQLISATSYYDRTIESQTDGTVYVKYYNAWACSYELDPAAYSYYWVNPDTGYAVPYPRYCFAPTQQGDIKVKNESPSAQNKFSQEFRLSSQGERMDWIVGLYYETSNDDWDSFWGYPTSNDYQDSLALRYWESSLGETLPNARNGWHAVSRADWEQKAIFGEATWRLNDQWTAIVGGRYYERDNTTQYYVENPETNLSPEFANDPSAMFSEGFNSGFVPKVSLSYSVSDSKMIYGMYTVGFRPGGVNYGRGRPILPRIYDEDKLSNYEIGAKTRWADGRVQANLTYYYMGWQDYQLEVIDPSFLDGEPWQQVVANAGDAHSAGITAELAWVPAEGWEVGGNANWIEAKTDTDVNLDDRLGPEVLKDTNLPNIPKFKSALWSTYSWPTNFIHGSAFVRLQYSYTGESANILQGCSPDDNRCANPQLTNRAYGIADMRVGLIADGGWEVNVFVNNLTDERADYFQSTGWFEGPFSSVADGRTGIGRIYTNRPREYGIRFTMRWGQ